MEKQEKQISNHVNVSFILYVCCQDGLLVRHSSITLFVVLTEEDSHAHYIFLTLVPHMK